MCVCVHVYVHSYRLTFGPAVHNTISTTTYQVLLKPLDSVISYIPLREISNIPTLKCQVVVYEKETARADAQDFTYQ